MPNQRRENHAHNDVPVPLRPTTLEKRHIQVLLEDLLEKFLADKRKRGSGILTFKKYPNKLGRIAPVIFWFADRFEKELMFKTAYVLSLLQKD